MAVDESQQGPPPRLATNDYLLHAELKDPDSFRWVYVLGICDKGIIVRIPGRPYQDVFWDDAQINKALLKTFGRKVRRA